MTNNMPTRISIFDCGCVPSRPKEQTCNSYGTRWRAYLTLNNEGNAIKVLLKCRDCGRIRHFALLGVNNPILIQYGSKGDDDK